jgi:cbb3-type cytochrome oxidase subunit 3
MLSTVAIYTILLATLWFAWKSERLDINCADNAQTLCGPGKGRAYYNSRPDAADTIGVLVDKLNATGHYDSKVIHWRRPMMIGIIGMFTLALVGRGELDIARNIGISVIVVFLVAYGFSMFYRREVSKMAEAQMDAIAKIIKVKLELANNVLESNLSSESSQ